MSAATPRSVSMAQPERSREVREVEMEERERRPKSEMSHLGAGAVRTRMVLPAARGEGGRGEGGVAHHPSSRDERERQCARSAARPASETSRHPLSESICSCGSAAPIAATCASCSASQPERSSEMSDRKDVQSTPTSRPQASEPRSERVESAGNRRAKARSADESGVPRRDTRVMWSESRGGRKAHAHSRQTQSRPRTSEQGRNEATCASVSTSSREKPAGMSASIFPPKEELPPPPPRCCTPCRKLHARLFAPPALALAPRWLRFF